MKKFSMVILFVFILTLPIYAREGKTVPPLESQIMEQVSTKSIKYMDAMDGKTAISNHLSLLAPSTEGIVDLLYHISNPYFLSFLLIVGIVGAVIELITPGFGAGGVLSAASFILFFSCNYVIGNSQWYAILIFLLGIFCVAIELVVPGFGIPGISGMVLLGMGLVMSFGNWIFALFSFAVALVLSFAIARYLIRSKKTSHFVDKTMLKAAFTHEKGFVSRDDPRYQVGDMGVALTDLHPSGFVKFGEEKTEVSSLNAFINRGERVKIIKIDGYNIFVSKI